MTSRFNNALLRFRNRLLENAGDRVEVYRGERKLLDSDAVPATSKVDMLSDKGVKTTTTVFDFVVPVSSGWEPKRGDRVIWRGNSYIVRPLGAEWWRFDDAEKVFIRVHCQREHEEE